MTERRLIRIDHVSKAGVVGKSLTPAALKSLLREVRSRQHPGVEVRCPKPRYRWKPGSEGPCGRKLRELYATEWGAVLEILAPLEQVIEPFRSPRRERYRLLAEPSKSRFVEPTRWPGGPLSSVEVSDWPEASGTGGSVLAVEAGQGATLSLDCPRCGVTNDLPSLTDRRVMR